MRLASSGSASSPRLRLPHPRGGAGVLLVIGLLALSSAAAVVAAQGASSSSQASSPAQSAWWNDQFAYRKSVTVTNPLNVTVVSSPLFMLVSFPFSHVSDAAAELRLVDQSGNEVPSYVLDELSTNGFVTSAWLLAFVSVQPLSSETFQLYYGNSAASVPSYRLENYSASATLGRLSVNVGTSSPASTSLQVTFAGTYAQGILSSVGYSGGASYGASGIAQGLPTVVSSLAYVANVSSSLVALSSAYSMGTVRYTQALVLDNGTLVDARLLTDTGTSNVTGLSLTDLVDSSSLAAIGPVTSAYNSSSGVLETGVAGGYFSYTSSPVPSSFEVGATATVESNALNGGLTNHTSAGTAAALSWRVGTLASGGSAQIITDWAVGGGAPMAGAGNLELAYGAEESHNGALAEVTSLWDVALPLANVSVGTGGATVPTQVDATPIASRLSLTGTASYVLPDGYASPSTQAGWAPQTAQTGGASAYSTTLFYSLQQGSYTSSVRASGGNGTGTAAAQLVSPSMSFPDSVTKHLVLTYRAVFTGGNFANEWLYVAVDAAQNPGGPFYQTLAATAAGSSSSIAGSGCGSLEVRGVPVVPQNDNVTYSAHALVADGSWRTLNVSLGALGNTASYLRVRLCAAVGSGYTGQLELDVSTAGIEAKGNAASFVTASVAPGGAIQLSFIPGATYEPSRLSVSGLVTFPALQTAPLTWNGATSYVGTIAALPAGGATDPPGSGANGTQAGTVGPRATFVGATVSLPPVPSSPEVVINGTAVPGVQLDQSVFVNSSDIAHGTGSPFSTAEVSLNYIGRDLSVKVEDSAGNPLIGAKVTIQGNSGTPVTEPATNATGAVAATLAPSTYAISVDYQGTSVGSTSVNLTTDKTVVVPTGVFSVPLKVKDALGKPIVGASMLIAGTAASFTLTTDGAGMASFLAVPNKEYNVTVSYQGATYYTGTLLASPGQGMLELGTSYLPTWIQLAIVGGVAVSMVGASIAVYVVRRRPRA